MSRLHFWHNLGKLCATFPLQIVCANFAICLLLFSYFLFYPLVVDTDIRQGFAHRHGRAFKEFEAFGEFYNISMKNIELIILVFTPKSSGQTMEFNLKLLDEVKRVDNFLNNLSVPIPSKNEENKLLKIKEIQASRGNVNFLFDTFKWGLEMQEDNARNNISNIDRNIVLDYPFSSIYGHKFPIRSHFFDVEFYNDSEIHTTTIKSVGMVTLWYMLEVPHTSLRPYLQQIEVKMYETSGQDTFSHLFSVYMYGDEIANYEMMQGSKRTFKMLAVGMVIMIAFMTVVLRDLHWKQQLVLLSSALISPFFAIGVTISTMCWLNIQVNSLMSIMPFLILGVGVDDSFLLIHAWRKWGTVDFSKKEKESSKTTTCDITSNLLSDSLDKSDSMNNNKNGSVVVPELLKAKNFFTKRQVEIYRTTAITTEVGPSMFITSLTNMLAFGSGYFSPSSLLSVFCLSTSMAVLFNFVFQFTFFLPCLLFSGRLIPSTQSRHQLHSDSKSSGVSLLTEKSFVRADKNSWNLWDKYSLIVSLKWTRWICVALLTLIYILAFVGARQMRPSFEPQKTFPKDSRLQTSVTVINHLILQYSPITFIVNMSPDISDRSQLSSFRRMIDELMNLPNAASIDIWLDEYLKYNKLKVLHGNGEGNESNNAEFTFKYSYEYVPSFLSDYLLDDKHVVVWHYDKARNNSVVVDKFAFVLVSQGKRDWHERAYFVDQVRTLTDNYPQFNVTAFDYDSTIYDLIITVKVEMLKSILVTLVCMAVVCSFVIANAKYTAMAVLSVFSTSFTLLGMLGWWGLDLDPVTLIAFLMAIGLSVDITAHICFHFYKLDTQELHRNSQNNKNKSLQQRLKSKEAETLNCDINFSNGNDGDNEQKLSENGEKRLNDNASDSNEHIKSTMTTLEKNKIILNTIGKPMLEASISTVICMLPLFFIPIYVVGSFAKTVVAVGVLSAIHGLFIVPVFLSMPMFSALCSESKPLKNKLFFNCKNKRMSSQAQKRILKQNNSELNGAAKNALQNGIHLKIKNENDGELEH